jgi:hypothetical protein
VIGQLPAEESLEHLPKLCDLVGGDRAVPKLRYYMERFQVFALRSGNPQEVLKTVRKRLDLSREVRAILVDETVDYRMDISVAIPIKED